MMAKSNFSAAFVRQVSCPEGKEKVRFYDEKCKGLMLEVRNSDMKTYFLRYYTKLGATRQLKLARVSDISLANARKLAQKYLARIAMGEDPLEELRENRQVPTLRVFAENRYLNYVKTYKKSWNTDEYQLQSLAGHEPCRYQTLPWRCWLRYQGSKGVSLPLPIPKPENRLWQYFVHGIQQESELGWKMCGYTICVTLLPAF